MSRNRSALSSFNRDVIRPGPQRGLRVVVPGGGGTTSSVAPVFVVTVNGGNDVYPASGVWSVVKGIKYNAASLSVLPAAAPTAGTTYADGIGYGNLLDATGAIVGLVWLMNRTVTNATSTGSFSPVTPQPVVSGGCTFCLYAVPMNVTGGGTATAYVVWRV